MNSSRSAGKCKCEFEDANSKNTKKAQSSTVFQCSDKLHGKRDPGRDCYCDQGRGFIIVKQPRYYDSGAQFGQVSEIGHFSVNEHREFRHDQSQLKYLHLPKNVLQVNLDLNVGYGSSVKQESPRSERLDFMLRWVLANKPMSVKSDCSSGASNLLKSLSVDFLCFRGLLTSIFTTPYERREGWSILATKFKGTIYLHAIPTSQQIQRELNMSEREKLMCSWGYKFEQYMTKRNPIGRPESPDTPVNEKEEYCAVFKSKLNNNVLLYGAEMDGVAERSTNKVPVIGGGRYIELKTSRIITTEGQDISFCKYKTVKWWAQCFLATVSKLYCGFRDESGIVQYIRTFNLDDLPIIGEGLWSPSVCINFGNCFLSFVRNTVVKDDPSVVYRFDFDPKCSVSCKSKELDPAESLEHRFLPDWYTSEFEA